MQKAKGSLPTWQLIGYGSEGEGISLTVSQISGWVAGWLGRGSWPSIRGRSLRGAGFGGKDNQV